MTEVDFVNELWRTRDGGRKWELVSKLPSEFTVPRLLKFVDAFRGWAISTGALWRTADGGANWQKVLSPLTPGAMGGPQSGAFIGYSKAWVLGEHGELYTTVDAGKTWTVRTVDGQADFTEIFFTDELNGWLKLPVNQAGNGEFYRSYDGGVNWWRQPAMPANATLFATDPYGDDEAHGIGQAGDEQLPDPTGADEGNSASWLFWNSIDGGHTWNSSALDLPDPVFWKVKFADSQHGWLIGSEYLYSSDDAGRTWHSVLRF